MLNDAFKVPWFLKTIHATAHPLLCQCGTATQSSGVSGDVRYMKIKVCGPEFWNFQNFGHNFIHLPLSWATRNFDATISRQHMPASYGSDREQQVRKLDVIVAWQHVPKHVHVMTQNGKNCCVYLTACHRWHNLAWWEVLQEQNSCKC